MARKPMPRLSVPPLDGLLNAHEVDLAAIDGRLEQAMWNARKRGYIPLSFADEIACKALRLHPHEVWGQEYEDAVWFDMYDDDEPVTTAKVIPFPAPTPSPEPVLRLVAA